MLRTIELSEQEIRHLRLRAQHLLIDTKSAISNIAQLLQSICGVQAQYPSDAALALRVRMNNLTSTELKQTLIDERTSCALGACEGHCIFLQQRTFTGSWVFMEKHLFRKVNDAMKNWG